MISLFRTRVYAQGFQLLQEQGNYLEKRTRTSLVVVGALDFFFFFLPNPFTGLCQYFTVRWVPRCSLQRRAEIKLQWFTKDTANWNTHYNYLSKQNRGSELKSYVDSTMDCMTSLLRIHLCKMRIEKKTSVEKNTLSKTKGKSLWFIFTDDTFYSNQHASHQTLLL